MSAAHNIASHFNVSSRRTRSLLSVATMLTGLLLLGGCATYEPAPRPHHRVEQPPPPAPAPAPATQVYVYPTSGQTAAQLDRDRYECHTWAVKQSGFDPSQDQVAPHQQVQVVSMPPPGTNVVAGAATGAVLGAVVSRPGNAGGGAVIGAIAGAMLGAASDSARQQQVDTVQRRYDQRDAQVAARLEQQASGYRRALGACLEGRGYTVK
ncbi:MAG TPA: glycine zipper 2TM domain-containing protein [Steroidobacteraceae bacterium]